MSHQFWAPELPPDTEDKRAFTTWLTDTILQLTAHIEHPILPIHYVAPDKPRLGQIVFADGTSWNPGSGRGVYCYDTTGPTWRFLG